MAPQINSYMNKKLLDILVCPVSKAPLQWHSQTQELVCKVSRLAYPVRDGIPVMLETEARRLEDGEDPDSELHRS